MIRSRGVLGLRFSHRGVIPLVVAVAMLLLFVAGLLLAFSGIPITIHIGSPAP